jgi:Bacterial low temperature requirement A protein (LtrA)
MLQVLVTMSNQYDMHETPAVTMKEGTVSSSSSSSSDDGREHMLLRTSSSMNSTGSGAMHMRRLFSRTEVLQDWDQEIEHDHNASVNYWELFIDLLLVAAASSIAETFRDSQNLSQFFLSYMIIINGWFLYSYHISTRFENSSFCNSLLLFIYLVGFGWTIVNIRDFSDFTSNEDDNEINDNDAVRQFVIGATILRTSIMMMIGTIACTLPRARYFCRVVTMIVCASMTGYVTTYIGTIKYNVRIIQIGLWIAAITETFSEIMLVRFIDIKKFVPVNIPQSQERFDALGLVMLGETVVSITQTYREFAFSDSTTESNIDESSKQDENAVHERYYIIMALSLLLIFMITLFLFHTAPSPEEHAIRRSKAHAVTLITLQKLIGLPLLAVGVSVKLFVEAIVTQEEVPIFGYQCMSFGVGMTLLVNFVIRLLHHGWKKQLTFGNHVHVFGSNPMMTRIAMIWWYTIGTVCLIPFVWYFTGITTKDPTTTTAYHAGLVFMLCFIESSYTHILLDLIPKGKGHDVRPNGVIGEKQPLL